MKYGVEIKDRTIISSLAFADGIYKSKDVNWLINAASGRNTDLCDWGTISKKIRDEPEEGFR